MPDLVAIAEAWVQLFAWSLGYWDAVFGLGRDWSRPDAWHRGYLRGRLWLCHMRIEHACRKAAEADPREGAGRQPRQAEDQQA